MCDRHREKYRVRQKERSSWKWYNMVSLQNGIKNLAIVQAKYKKSCLLWLSSGIGVLTSDNDVSAHLDCSIPSLAVPFHICIFGSVVQNFKSHRDINQFLSHQNIRVFFFTSFPLIP